MADFRQIHTRIWKDAWFMDLDTEDKLLFIYLFSNERASVAGIYELSMKVIIFESGLTRERITAALDRFRQARKVFYENGIVWVVNLRKYNANASPKVSSRIKSDVASIPDCHLKKTYLDFYNGRDTTTTPEYTVSIPYPELNSEQEQEKEHEQEQKNLGADAPPKPPKGKKSELMDNPAVIAYRDKMLVTPGLAARKAMAEKVKDLALWARVLEAWTVNQYNPQNVAGMIDAYGKGGVNGNNRPVNGRAPVLGTPAARKAATFDVRTARTAGDK